MAKQPISKLKCFFVFLFFSPLLMVLTYCNLESNYVYYYQHSPRTDKKGLPFVALDQLWWYVEGEYEERGSYHYDLDGTAKVTYGDFHLGQSNWPENSYMLMEYVTEGDNKEKYYEFDDKFNLISVSYLTERRPFSKADEQYALKAARKVTQQIIDESTRPIINLQWIYDLLDWGNIPRDVRSGVAFIDNDLE